MLASLRVTFGVALAAALVDASSACRSPGPSRATLSGPAPVRRHRRSAVRAADRRRRHRALDALRAERLARRAAGDARGQGRLYALGHPDRAGLRRPAVRRADARADHRGARTRAGGGLGDARREPPGDDLARGRFRELTPALLTGMALAFARGVGEYGSVIFIAGNLSASLRDRAAPDRREARRIRLRGRDRDRRDHAGALLRHAAGDQRPQAGRRRKARPCLSASSSARTPSRRRSPPRLRCALIASHRVSRPVPARAARRRRRRSLRAKDLSGYLSALADPDALAAIALTLTIAAIVVPLNAAFGLSAAWAIAKFSFPRQEARSSP